MGLYLPDEVLYSNKNGWNVNHSQPSLFSDSIIACSHFAKFVCIAPKQIQVALLGLPLDT